MAFSNFIEWVFIGVLSSGALGAVTLLWLIWNRISSIDVKLEVMFQAQLEDGKELDDHENRIRYLERYRA